MVMNDNNKKTDSLFFEDKEITLIGTAHVSRESAEQVSYVINDEKPDTVCIELCEPRYQTIRQKNKWQDMDLVKVIKEKKAFLLLSNLLLSSFQKRIADQFGIKPGEEILKAIESAESVKAEIYLADREIHITLSRIWRVMGLWDKLKLLFQLMLSLGGVEDIKEEDVEKMKQEDVLESILSEVEKVHPILRNILIDERDKYLAHKIKNAPGKKIVAVVGAGHVPGIRKYWEHDIDIKPLEEIPPKTAMAGAFKWGLPLIILSLFVYGFYHGGKDVGTHMIGWWVLANGVLAVLGAIIAFGHPLTVLSSILAAPLTSLNPMIAAGWVSGLVEVFARKPKVRDMENLTEDITTVRGLWRNKVTRVLLVVVFTNIGSSLGTFVAIPLMLKVFNS